MRPRFSPPSRVWLHVRDVVTILIIMRQSTGHLLKFYLFFFTVLKKSEMRKVCLKRLRKSVKFQEKDEIPLNYEGGENRGRIETLTAGD